MWKYLTFAFILTIAFFILLFNTGWASDDAYITLRTVHNFVTGDGLVWNLGERVQVYTHPLWMFFLSAIYFFTREDFFTLIFTSIAVSVAFAFYSFAFVVKDAVKAFILLSCFVFSKAFIDYSTSGLENPLSHMLIAVFILLFYDKDQTEKNFFKLCILSALLLLIRLDFIFLIGPSLLYRLSTHRSFKTLRWAILFFLPLWLWEIFSIIYYGFPLPNTAYGKLCTGITFLSKVEHGLQYLLNSITTDHVTLPVIGVSVLILLLKKRLPSATIAIGSLLYLAYIVCIGGDFMSGRFITAPFVFAVLAALMEIKFFPAKNWVVTTVITTVIFASLAILGMTIKYPPLITGIDYGKVRKGLIDKYRIVDERGFYFPSSGLKTALHSKKNFPIHVFAKKGRRWKKANKKIVRKFVSGHRRALYPGPVGGGRIGS